MSSKSRFDAVFNYETSTVVQRFSLNCNANSYDN